MCMCTCVCTCVCMCMCTACALQVHSQIAAFLYAAIAEEGISEEEARDVDYVLRAGVRTEVAVDSVFRWTRDWGAARAAAEAVDAIGAGGDGSSSAQPAPTSLRAGFEPTIVYPPDPGFAARWNQALDAAVGQVGVDHTLRAYEALECTKITLSQV